MRPYPSYLKLMDNGEIDKRIEALYTKLECCDLCPNRCEVNRLKGERGFCKVLDRPMVSSYGPHFGEERPLVGKNGSGAIFFTYCNMACVYCQNWEISHLGDGDIAWVDDLAKIMLILQAWGCHNINLVTPTHQVPFIVKAIKLAAEKGLRLPIVYNCGGYESLDTLKLLEDIVDIYMPDIKYMNDEVALKLSKVKNYSSVVKTAVKEMYRQVGDLVIEDGIAKRGLIVRHLVLPQDLSQTEEVIKFIAEEISKDTYFNLMDQYRPCGDAWKYPPLDRKITQEEWERALSLAKKYGLKRLDDRRARFWDI
ncbi:radical SAM protein [Thermodesulfobacterium sp. TA1]|uniref:radical SAM protein n=1 Tax=Thermodesulfobacterium sp. TA1 TaxID=2234087 RepID=UPI001232B0A6|nr:radical SAM protein [Thermodesulfobacterium sp. TA1]QER41820.1 radical SAM protein [Thermodesulfobacterium sp. TA1]